MLTTLTINNREITVSASNSVLQACEQAGYIVPRFCYHEKLSVAGSCRMCLVEIQKSPKPVVSCAMPITKGMVVFTNTPLVKKARESILESLLLNHPLDCPICDQGGECDLQDETLSYGSDRGRYYVFKRSVEDKECGPIIKTIMTRCIHCTRCIRFSSEIAGQENLGSFGRGKDMEIGTYVESFINTELSGNLIDLCPVGALTSKPYSYKTRNWEIQKKDTVDFFDAVCSDIIVSTRKSTAIQVKNNNALELTEDTILRILPKNDGLYKDNWISDRSRYAFDGLKNSRLTASTTSWEDFVLDIGNRLFHSNFSTLRIGALVGNLSDLQEIYFLTQFIKFCGGTDVLVGNFLPKANYDIAFFYSLNRTIDSLDTLNTLILIGLNTRYEASLLNTTLRKHQRNRGLTYLTIGTYAPLELKQKHVGNSLRALIGLSENKIKNLSQCYLNLNTSIFFGFENTKTKHGYLLQNIVRFLGKKLVTKTAKGERLGILHNNISTLNCAHLGISVGVRSPLFVDVIKDKEISTLFLIQSEDFKNEKWLSTKTYTHVVGLATNAISGLQYDHLIPITSLYEKNGYVVNIEGRLRKLNKVVSSKINTKSLEIFFSTVIEYAFITRENSISIWKSIWNFNNEINLKSQIEKIVPQFLFNLFQVTEIEFKSSIFFFSPNIYNFYCNDIISKNSKTMSECSLFFYSSQNFFYEVSSNEFLDVSYTMKSLLLQQDNLFNKEHNNFNNKFCFLEI